ncbi:MAG: Mur ligase domain-containing protein, partial [Verrucomicrobiaceae bacterium]|nr:Mur ligase domain-containing protein [Verrucomicrobiaceae bacterium]
MAGGSLAAGDAGAPISRISTDSRTLQDGDLFVPLRGENFDGHKFVQQAVERGAAGAMVEESWK